MATSTTSQTMKPKMDHKNGIWARILLPMVALAVAGGVAWGLLRQEVTSLAEQNKVIHPLVTDNCRDIAVLKSRLSGMNDKLDKILDKLDR